VFGAQPRLEPRTLDLPHWSDALRDAAGSVGLQEHGNPVFSPECRPQEEQRHVAVDEHLYPPVFDSATWPRNVDCASEGQSTPEKSASMVVRSAVPTLSRVPAQPRGDE